MNVLFDVFIEIRVSACNILSEKMKIQILTILGLSGLLSIAGEPVQSILLSKVVAASKTGSTIKFGTGHDMREITFRDVDTFMHMPVVEPMILSISKKIERLHFPAGIRELSELSLLDARKTYVEYSKLIKKHDLIPELNLCLSQNTDEELLRQVLTTVCPRGASSVWITYFEPYPIRLDSVNNRHKPVPPENQRNPVLMEDASSNPYLPLPFDDSQ